MSNIRLNNKPEIGRDLNDNDLIFVSKTNENTDNPSTFSRIKTQLTNVIVGVTNNLYSLIGHVHAQYSNSAETLSLSSQMLTKSNVSGQTFTGNVSAPTISATTLISGSTNLYNIFSTTDTITRVQSGTNILTGGTPNCPTINLISSPFINNLTASGITSLQTVYATSFVSGSTNLYNIFSTTDTITRVQSGSNIITGGTANNPIINLITSPSVNNFTASGSTSLQTVSASTLFTNTISGSSSFNINGASINNGHINAPSISGNNFYGDGSSLTNLNLQNTSGQLPLSSYTDSFVSNTIIVGKSGLVQFYSIKDAVDSIANADSNNRYTIFVHPGIYVEDTIDLKEYVDIKAISENTTIIESSSIGNLINVVGNTTLYGLILRGSAKDGQAIFNLSSDMGAGKTCTIINCTIGDTNIILNSDLNPGEYGLFSINGLTSSFGSSFKNGFVLNGSGNVTISLEDSKTSIMGNTVDFIYITGPSNKFILTNVGLLIQTSLGASLENFIRCSDGAVVQSEAVSIDGASTGIYNENYGSGCQLDLFSFNIFNATVNDINILNPATTGSFMGHNSYSKTYINPLSSFYVNYRDSHIIKVLKSGGDFASIAEAVNSITHSNEYNSYEILVGAGIFVEPVIDLTAKPYVSIIGSSIMTTEILADNPDHNIIEIGAHNELSFLTITSAGTGFAGVSAINSGDYFMLHKVSIHDCETCIRILSDSADTFGYLEYVDLYGNIKQGIVLQSNFGKVACLNVENFYTSVTNDLSTTSFTAIRIIGGKSFITLNSSGVYGSKNINITTRGNSGIVCSDGASIIVTSSQFINFETAILNENSGSGCKINIAGTIFKDNNLFDVNILNPNTIGGLIGSSQLSKIYIVEGSTFSPFFTNNDTNSGVVIIGDIQQGDKQSTLLNFSKMVLAQASLGLASGGEISSLNDLTVTINAGSGYLISSNDNVKDIYWPNTNLIISSAQTQYITVNENNVISNDLSKPDGIHKILLGSVYPYGGRIHYLENAPIGVNEIGNRTIEFFDDSFGVVFATGGIVSENGTRGLNVTGGERYYSLNAYNSTGGTPVFFEEHYHNSDGSFRHGAFTATTVRNDVYDNGSGLTSITSGYYAKHSLYITGEKEYEHYLFVYSQNQYSGLTEAISGSLPAPPTSFVDSTCIIASIVTKQGVNNIIQVRDERPIISFNASSLSTSLLHGNLQGLTADDHKQYLLTNGSRFMEGDLNVNNYDIKSAATINGIVLETHSSRHLPNGQDPLSTGIPLSINTTNQEGVNNSFSRSDHVHSHGSQSGGTTHSLATNSVSGFMSYSDKSYLDSTESIFSSKADVSGQTFTGNIKVPVISANTIISGTTNLYNIFSTTDTNDITRVQPGSNITTGGTANNPIIGLITSPSVNNFTASGATSLQTVSAATFISGSTNLYNIFSTTDTNDITRVQPGSNVTTGGTANNPIINLATSPSVNNFTVSGTTSLQTISATTFISGSTNLYNIFSTTDTNDITSVQPGSNITTGGTINSPIINLVASPLVNNLTASGATSLQTISATTFISGSTNLYNIFSTINSSNQTSVQPGTNITTGGTQSNPTVNLVASPFVNNFTSSGTSSFQNITISAGTNTTPAIRLNSGTTLTSTQTGAIEYDGRTLYYTNQNSIRQPINTAAYGYFYEDNATGTIYTLTTAGNTYGWTSATPSTNYLTSFNHSTSVSSGDSVVILTGGEGDYLINVNGSVSLGNQNQTYRCVVYKNQLIQSNLGARIRAATAAAWSQISINGIATGVTSNDIFDLRFIGAQNGNTVTVYNMAFNIKRIKT